MTWHRDRPGFLRTAAICAVVAGLSAVAVPAAGAATASTRAHASTGSAAWRQPSWRLVDTGTQTHFRGLSVVSRNVAWLGGYDGMVLPTAGMPPALPGEAGFAASGECLTTFGHDAWFGSGASTAARVFGSRDGGLTWHVATTPVVAGPTAGVFALAFRTPLAGVAV